MPPHYQPLDLENGVPSKPPRFPFFRHRLRLLLVLALVFFLTCVAYLTHRARPPLIRPPPAPVFSPSRAKLASTRPDALTISPDPPAKEVLGSARWAPLAVANCTPNMPQHYAPCLATRRPGAVYGEELLYPDFRLRAPNVAKSRESKDLEEWRRLVRGVPERASWCKHGEDWVCYRAQHGQNIVLANATFVGAPPPDGWGPDACMGELVSTLGIAVAPANLTSQDEYDAAFPIDALVVATSPDSWSFQHFLDRVTHIAVQSRHVTAQRSQAPHVVAGRTPAAAVSELWELLGFPAERRHHGGAKPSAKEVVFSCRAPLVHPWLSLRTLETFGLDPVGVPLEQRKKVMYMSRSHGHANNAGRRVLNEEALLDAIRKLLEERGEGEELVLFREEDFGSQRELIELFHRDVRAVIGPHGGALFHHRWTGRDTLLLEMMPTSFTSVMFWEEASILGQVYATTILEPSGTTNMDADIPAVLEILTEHLGKADSRGSPIEDAYFWKAPELLEP